MLPVQALVSPAEKLIEAISRVIGKTYELKLISDTVRNNSDVPIVYDSTGILRQLLIMHMKNSKILVFHCCNFLKTKG